MMNVFWKWKISIAPVQITYKDFSGKTETNMGAFTTKKTFKGLRLPRAGETILIPNYGICKIERVIHPSGRASRFFTNEIVISPNSLGDTDWWKNNINHPISRYPENWKIGADFSKGYFKDIL